MLAGDKKVNANVWSAAKKSEHQRTTQYKMLGAGNKTNVLGPGSAKPKSTGGKATKEQLTTQYKMRGAGDKIAVSGSAKPKSTATKLAEEQKTAPNNVPVKRSNGAANGMKSTQDKTVAPFNPFDDLVATVNSKPTTAAKTKHVFDSSANAAGSGNGVHAGHRSGRPINTAARNLKEHLGTQYTIRRASEKVVVLGSGSAKSTSRMQNNAHVTKSAEDQKTAQHNARVKGPNRAGNGVKPNQKKALDPFDFDDLTLGKSTVAKKNELMLKPSPGAVDAGNAIKGWSNSLQSFTQSTLPPCPLPLIPPFMSN